MFDSSARWALSSSQPRFYRPAVGGRIEGTISDPTGAVVQGAAVSVIKSGTGVEQRLKTGQDGTYAFPVLSVGSYAIRVTVSGFKPYERTGIAVDANGALVVNVSLVPGTKTETLTVNDSAVHVDSSSNQMGEVISGRQMTAVPLNGRSFTDLLSLQPGVAPATSISCGHGSGCRRELLFAVRQL